MPHVITLLSPRWDLVVAAPYPRLRRGLHSDAPSELYKEWGLGLVECEILIFHKKDRSQSVLAWRR
jgi:hypothetical protein